MPCVCVYKQSEITRDLPQIRIDQLMRLTENRELQALKLPSLEFRRRRGDMIQVFKIMNGLDTLDPDIFFLKAEGICTTGEQGQVTHASQ